MLYGIRLFIILTIISPFLAFAEMNVLYHVLDNNIEAKYYIGTYNLNENYILHLQGEFPFAGKYPVTMHKIFGGYLTHLQLALEKIPEGKSLLVILDSPGGGSPTADAAVDLIRNRCNAQKSNCKITVFVPKICASACIAFYKNVGDIHVAHEEARFGFHASRNIFYKLSSEEESISAYSNIGINEEWLSSLKQRGAFRTLDVTWATASEMKKVNLVDSVQELELYNKAKNYFYKLPPWLPALPTN